MKKQRKWTKRTSNIIPKKTNIGHRNRKLTRRAKQLLVAVGSAIFIGTMFGLITLQMSKQEDPHHATILNSSTSDEHGNSEMKQTESISVYVVQGGVFGEEENAKEWASKFENVQFPAINWKQGTEYYLLTGVAHSEESANKLAGEMDEQGLDVFVKKWEVDSVSLALSDTDHQWLLSFTGQWGKSLQAGENATPIKEEEWLTVTEQSAGLTDPILSFNKTIVQQVQMLKGDNTNKQKEQQFLLQLLYDYERLTSEHIK